MEADERGNFRSRNFGGQSKKILTGQVRVREGGARNAKTCVKGKRMKEIQNIHAPRRIPCRTFLPRPSPKK
ncbi:hypothetical protein [uncultured Mailhella sp.]|uniref:hypothetical protein n=1 Tax=uncultured Mailhella sp. TaxID=1981031 RepID=UPI00320B65B6